MANFVKLDNGQFLFNDGGKYRPNLTFICDQIPENDNVSNFPWYDGHTNDFNMEGRSLNCLRGDYWQSAKKTNCFRPKKDGKHILVQESWGHSRDRGDLNEETGMVYFRRASSNGGGNGYTYAILPVGWTKQISLEDI